MFHRRVTCGTCWCKHHNLLPSAWRLGSFAKILDNLEFLIKILDFFFICCQDLGFLGPFSKTLAINLGKKSEKNQDLARKFKIMLVEIREENHSCFYNYKLRYKYFSSYTVKLARASLPAMVAVKLFRR